MDRRKQQNNLILIHGPSGDVSRAKLNSNEKVDGKLITIAATSTTRSTIRVACRKKGSNLPRLGVFLFQFNVFGSSQLKTQDGQRHVWVLSVTLGSTFFLPATIARNVIKTQLKVAQLTVEHNNFYPLQYLSSREKYVDELYARQG